MRNVGAILPGSDCMDLAHSFFGVGRFLEDSEEFRVIDAACMDLYVD
jgi:hypothetical protein